MAQRCCEAMCVCVCMRELVRDGGGGHNMVMVTSTGITDAASPVKTKTTLSECGQQRRTGRNWRKLWCRRLLFFLYVFILIFTIQSFLFKCIMMDILYSVRSAYSTKKCILWQWLNDMNRGNIAQFSGLYCVLLSLCNTERSKLWNIMWHMWDLFSGITKLPLKNG